MNRGWLVLAVLATAGCATVGPDAPEAAGPQSAPQSFSIAPPERLSFEMPDGVELVATLWRPVGLESMPVILHAQPYASMCSVPGSPFPSPCVPPTSDEFWLNEYNGLPRSLVEAGFAYVDMNVRGTGPSGGCFTINGPEERDDLGVVIDALSRAEWSTGQVGMMGLSYMGTTPFVALGDRPPALKAILAGGILVNEYYAYYSPQGAARSVEDQLFHPMWFGSVTVMPALGGDPANAGAAAANYPDRLCPDTIELVAHPTQQLATDDRPRQFFLERRHVANLRDLDAGVLVIQGLRDRGQGMQIEPLWEALGDTPRAFVMGDWEHQFPDSDLLAGSDGLRWPDLPISWFDHYLRGGPEPAIIGEVHHEILGKEWRVGGSWPAAPSEALYLDGAALSSMPGPGDLSFRSLPDGRPCGDAGEVAWAVALTEPLASPAMLAGNPMAWLQIQVDQPSATIAIDLWDVPADDVCAGELLTTGAADLRYIDDPFRAQDAPMGRELGVRVDLFATSWEVPAGHRIGVTFSSAGGFGATGRPTAATVTIHAGESHILLPTSAGVGGAPPVMTYPAVPLGPDWEP